MLQTEDFPILQIAFFRPHIREKWLAVVSGMHIFQVFIAVIESKWAGMELRDDSTNQHKTNHYW